MNELERLLVRATQDPVARPRFYQALVDSTLYVLTPVPADEGSRTLQAGEQVHIVNWQGGDEEIVPVFSSLERLNGAIRESGETYGYLALQGQKLFELLSQGSLRAVLNPNWAFGREFLPDEMKRLGNGTFSNPARTEVVERDRSVLVGQPREIPHELLAALKKYFSSAPQVLAAYLALYVDVAVGPDPRLVVTITGTGNVESVVKDVGIISREIMSGGPAVDFVVVAPGEETPLSGGSAPFFERGS